MSVKRLCDGCGTEVQQEYYALTRSGIGGSISAAMGMSQTTDYCLTCANLMVKLLRSELKRRFEGGTSNNAHGTTINFHSDAYMKYPVEVWTRRNPPIDEVPGVTEVK